MKKISDFKSYIKKKKNEHEIRNTPSGFHFLISDSINYINANHWNKIVPNQRLLMRPPYLRALEQSNTLNDRYKYVIFYDESQQPVAAAVMSIITIYGHDYGSLTEEKESQRKNIKNNIKNKIKLRTLVCGHTHISGDHGFIYDQSQISSKKAYHALADVCYQIRRGEKLHGTIDLVLIKDFYGSEKTSSENLQQFSYRQIKVDPNMQLTIQKNWITFDDYLNAMRTKYRKKALSVIKKGTPLKRLSLSAPDILSQINRIEELYLNVANKSKARINHYDANYFYQLKRELNNSYDFVAYYLNDVMVGFTTTIFWGDNCEGHSIGIDYDFNKKYNIYQNILYDDVRLAIEAKKKKIILGRTAMEMKSNIGAQPEDMYCYMRHSGPISNRAIKPLFNYIKTNNWTQRNPFKEESN